MSRLSDYAAYITSPQQSSFSSLDGNSRLNVVNAFYADKGLERPQQITLTSSVKGIYLSKDDKLKIQMDYIKALQAGKMTSELENNLKAVTDPSSTATFSENYTYSEAVKALNPAVVAAKLIDALPVKCNEEFHKIRKFNVPASVSISEIPAFIEELRKIYENQKSE